jgi:proline iminopeptidase
MTGAGSLANYKRLNNLVEKAAFVDPQYIELWMIEPGDEQRPAPPRAIWLQSVRSIDYRRRLSAVRAPTWLAVGRADPETPLPCSKELQRGIPDARLVVFECSGHAPFIEEPQRFIQELEGFLT